MCYSEVRLVGGQALDDRIGSADMLQASSDVGVIQVRVVAAVTADDLEHAGIPAFYPAVHEVCGLASQHGGAAMTELASWRERGAGRSVHRPQPFVTGIRRSRGAGTPSQRSAARL